MWEDLDFGFLGNDKDGSGEDGSGEDEEVSFSHNSGNTHHPGLYGCQQYLNRFLFLLIIIFFF